MHAHTDLSGTHHQTTTNQSFDDEKIKQLFKELFLPSGELIKDPVVASDGFTYERTEIEELFKKEGVIVSPKTNKPFLDKTLIPNHTIKLMIEQYEKMLSQSNNKVKSSSAPQNGAAFFENNDPLFKIEKTVNIFLVGHSTNVNNKVGRSSLLLKHTDKNFNDQINTFLNTDLREKKIGKVTFKYKITSQDNIAEKKLDTNIETLNNTFGVMLICDLTDRSSFERIERLHENAEEQLNSPEVKRHKVSYILVATKSDLTAQRVVTDEVLTRLKDRLKLDNVFVVSAKTGQNIDEAFTAISKTALANSYEKIAKNCVPVNRYRMF